MEFETLFRELTLSTEMIRSLLAGIGEEEACIKPDEESWSILEVVCHLYDEEREDFREHTDFILNRQHDEWHPINPQGWVTERLYNQQDFAKMKEMFFGERKKSLDWLQEHSEAKWETLYTSPFGSMKAVDMFACWVAHDNLHVRQLVELRRKHIERMTHPIDIQYAGDW